MQQLYTATHCNHACNTLHYTTLHTLIPLHAKKIKLNVTVPELQHTVSHCNTLYQSCNTLYHTATHCTRTATHCITLQHTVPELQHTVSHCNTLYQNCNTAHHTASHYTTLHYTATHCNTHTPSSCSIRRGSRPSSPYRNCTMPPCEFRTFIFTQFVKHCPTLQRPIILIGWLRLVRSLKT